MTTPENPNQDPGQDPNQVPRYGTPEYAAWYAQQHPDYQPGRNAAAEPPPKNSHKIRNSVIGVAAVVVALGVIGAIAGSGGGSGSDKPVAAAATKSQQAPRCLSNGMPDGGDMKAADIRYCQAHPGNADQSGATASPSEDYPTPSDVPSEAPTPSDTTDTSVLDLNPGASVSVENTDNGGQADITVGGPSVIMPGEYDDPAQGRYIGVKVTMKVTAGSFEINPYDFTLRSVDGTEVDQAFLDGDQTHPALNDGTGTADGGIDQVAGWLVFDLPAGFHGQLQYVPGLSDVLGSWKIGA